MSEREFFVRRFRVWPNYGPQPEWWSRLGYDKPLECTVYCVAGEASMTLPDPQIRLVSDATTTWFDWE